MKVSISRAALDAILREMRNAGGEECCGLLLSSGVEEAGIVISTMEVRNSLAVISAIMPAANVAADRRRHFEIDPATLIRAHRAQRAGEYRIIGCYHSHPGGTPAPSAEDATQAEANGWLWLICAEGEDDARLWRAVEGGAVHGRFDPVEMIV